MIESNWLRDKDEICQYTGFGKAVLEKKIKQGFPVIMEGNKLKALKSLVDEYLEEEIKKRKNPSG